jgi:hypothetical protein
LIVLVPDFGRDVCLLSGAVEKPEPPQQRHRVRPLRQRGPPARLQIGKEHRHRQDRRALRIHQPVRLERIPGRLYRTFLPGRSGPLRQADRAYKAAIAELAAQASLGIQPRSVTNDQSRQAPVATRNPT